MNQVRPVRRLITAYSASTTSGWAVALRGVGGEVPNGLKGDEIPLSGRLMAVADVYDALISKRVYKPAFSHDKAKSIILEGEGNHFDPDVIAAFLAVEDQFVAIAAEFDDKEEAA